jgi:hypothetical protein
MPRGWLPAARGAAPRGGAPRHAAPGGAGLGPGGPPPILAPSPASSISTLLHDPGDGPAPGVLKVTVESISGLDGPSGSPFSVAGGRLFYVLECAGQHARSGPPAADHLAPGAPHGGRQLLWGASHRFVLASNEAVMRATVWDEGARAVVADGVIDLTR